MGGVPLAIIAVLIVALAVGCVLLPLLIYRKVNEAINVLREMRGELTRMRKYYEPDIPQATQLMQREPK